MVEVKEVQPGVFEVKTVNTTVKALELAYGTAAMLSVQRRFYEQIAAANAAPVPSYVPEFKRKPGTKIYGV